MGARVALSLKTACDYRKFRPCLNQDLCGTLITDLFEAAPRSRRTWSLLPCPVDECILAQGVRVAKQSGFGSAYFGGIDQGEAAFPLEEGKRRRRRLAPAKPKFQRVPNGILLIRRGIAQISICGYWERPQQFESPSLQRCGLRYLREGQI